MSEQKKPMYDKNKVENLLRYKTFTIEDYKMKIFKKKSICKTKEDYEYNYNIYLKQLEISLRKIGSGYEVNEEIKRIVTNLISMSIMMALYYHKGTNGFKKNKKKEKEYLKKAHDIKKEYFTEYVRIPKEYLAEAEKIHKNNMNIIDRETFNNNQQKFIENFENANDKVVGYYNLAFSYEHGIVVERNLEKAKQYYEEAIKNGGKNADTNGAYCKACNNLATIFYSEENVDDAVKYFKKAIKCNNEFAIWNLDYIMGKELSNKPLEEVEDGVDIKPLEQALPIDETSNDDDYDNDSDYDDDNDNDDDDDDKTENESNINNNRQELEIQELYSESFIQNNQQKNSLQLSLDKNRTSIEPKESPRLKITKINNITIERTKKNLEISENSELNSHIESTQHDNTRIQEIDNLECFERHDNFLGIEASEPIYNSSNIESENNNLSLNTAEILVDQQIQLSDAEIQNNRNILDLQIEKFDNIDIELKEESNKSKTIVNSEIFNIQPELKSNIELSLSPTEIIIDNREKELNFDIVENNDDVINIKPQRGLELKDIGNQANKKNELFISNMVEKTEIPENKNPDLEIINYEDDNINIEPTKNNKNQKLIINKSISINIKNDLCLDKFKEQIDILNEENKKITEKEKELQLKLIKIMTQQTQIINNTEENKQREQFLKELLEELRKNKIEIEEQEQKINYINIKLIELEENFINNTRIFVKNPKEKNNKNYYFLELKNKEEQIEILEKQLDTLKISIQQQMEQNNLIKKERDELENLIKSNLELIIRSEAEQILIIEEEEEPDDNEEEENTTNLNIGIQTDNILQFNNNVFTTNKRENIAYEEITDKIVSLVNLFNKSNYFNNLEDIFKLDEIKFKELIKIIDSSYSEIDNPSFIFSKNNFALKLEKLYYQYKNLAESKNIKEILSEVDENNNNYFTKRSLKNGINFDYSKNFIHKNTLDQDYNAIFNILYGENKLENNKDNSEDISSPQISSSNSLNNSFDEKENNLFNFNRHFNISEPIIYENPKNTNLKQLSLSTQSENIKATNKKSIAKTVNFGTMTNDKKSNVYKFDTMVLNLDNPYRETLNYLSNLYYLTGTFGNKNDDDTSKIGFSIAFLLNTRNNKNLNREGIVPTLQKFGKNLISIINNIEDSNIVEAAKNKILDIINPITIRSPDNEIEVELEKIIKEYVNGRKFDEDNGNNRDKIRIREENLENKLFGLLDNLFIKEAASIYIENKQGKKQDFFESFKNNVDKGRKYLQQVTLNNSKIQTDKNDLSKSLFKNISSLVEIKENDKNFNQINFENCCKLLNDIYISVAVDNKMDNDLKSDPKFNNEQQLYTISDGIYYAERIRNQFDKDNNIIKYNNEATIAVKYPEDYSPEYHKIIEKTDNYIEATFEQETIEDINNLTSDVWDRNKIKEIYGSRTKSVEVIKIEGVVFIIPTDACDWIEINKLIGRERGILPGIIEYMQKISFLRTGKLNQVLSSVVSVDGKKTLENETNENKINAALYKNGLSAIKGIYKDKFSPEDEKLLKITFGNKFNSINSSNLKNKQNNLVNIKNSIENLEENEKTIEI